jgi:nitroreductase
MSEAYDNLLKLCGARHSCRSFAQKPVPREDVERVVKAASTAPFASGSKSWEIVVVDSPAVIKEMAAAVRRRSEELAARMGEEDKNVFLTYSRFFTAFETAPVVLVPAFKDRRGIALMLPGEGLEAFERENSVKSISCACMLALLAAESLGLGACYMTGPLLAAGELAKLAGLKPGREPGALIPLGYSKIP